MIGKNKFEYFFFRAALQLIKILGLENSRRLAVIFGTFFYFVIPIRKKTTISNLQKAFPEKKIREIKRIALKNYQNIAVTFFELMGIPILTVEKMSDQVQFENLELLNKKIEEKKGLIIFTGHLGSWEFTMTSVTALVKKGMIILAKPQRNPYITKWLRNTRQKYGSTIIDPGVSVKTLYKALMDGEVVGVAGDQRGHKDSPRFNFFGNPTALYTGTESIALRTGSNVLLTANIRQKDFKYKCYMEELDFSNLPEDNDQKINELTQRYISFIEKYVRMSPEQYFWMHKIWKY